MPTKAIEDRADDLLNFVGALVKEHALLGPDERPGRSVLNRKPAKRTEPSESKWTQPNSDRS
jgi:hypothetical protein